MNPLHKYNTNKAVLIFIAGIIAISSSSILIRYCAAPAFTIAFYRLFLASLFYWGVALKTNTPIINETSRREIWYAILSGLFLAFHFATWITSLSYTSVASSVVLVQTSPVFVALGSYIFLKEKISRFCLAGVLIAIAGGIVIGRSDTGLGSSALFGNILAVAGAIGAAGYFVFGRQLRKSMSTLKYVTWVYSSAGIFILILVLAINPKMLTGFNLQVYLLLFAIAFIPQVIGHTSLNWALKYFSATAVAIVTLGESVCASILAWILFGETMSPVKILGGVILLCGVTIVLVAEKRLITTDI